MPPPPATHSRSDRQAPALHALFHQFLAFLLTFTGFIVLEAAYGIAPGIVAAACVQGFLAAALSGWRRLAPWWLLIQVLFPLALVATLALQLPSYLFLLLFLGFLAMYWSTFRTQVPYYPSTRAVWQAVAALLPADRPLAFIDIGCGFGGLVMHLAAIRPESRFAGIELAPLPWLAGKIKARIRRSRARFMRGDYLSLNFADYDVVFAYLSPAAMPALWEKAHTEMQPGAMLLSYEFAVPGQAPDFVVTPAPDRPVLHGWRM